MKDFVTSTKEIINHIDRCVDNLEGPAIAAFDADGTLWPFDVGTIFFEYQISKRLLPSLPSDPWFHYKQMREEPSYSIERTTRATEKTGKDQAVAQALLWLAQINEGQNLHRVQEWAEQALESASYFSTFNEQKEIIDHLHQRGVETFIVTASLKWSVEPAARLYNIDPDHVLGVTTKVINHIVTDQPEGPITYKEGKREGLLHKTGGVKPFLCAGNTEADLPLLELATHIKVAVASAPHNHENYHTEQSLQRIALQNHWHSLNYLPQT